MIKYQLTCATGHDFESWFGSGGAYDTLRIARQVHCPVCGTHDIEKRPMAPAIVTGRSERKKQETLSHPVADMPQNGAVPAAPEAVVKAALETLRQLKAEVIANTENVGDQFAEEARRIHYGESTERPIRGEATAEEARQLHEDGIDFGILPRLPEEQN